MHSVQGEAENLRIGAAARLGERQVGVIHWFLSKLRRLAGWPYVGPMTPHEPCPLAELPYPLKSVVLEQLDRCDEQEAALCCAPCGYLGDCLDTAPTCLRDQIQRPFQ